MSRQTPHCFVVAMLTIWCVVIGACESKPEPPAPTSVASIHAPTEDDAKPRDYAGLHNVVAYHDSFYSGSVPEGENGFAALAGMGVKTIISVDGAAPDLDSARALGIRYIHLPIGYNGFDEHRKLELVRAARDAMDDGPVYIHCHHGKHRSAGAAATIAASLGWSTPEQMVERMRVSGTSAAYKGLYACAAAAVTLPEEAIDAVSPDFPEVSRPQGLVKGMVALDEINERLKLIEKAKWLTPADHPDLVPVAEAGRMADILRLLCVDDRVKSRPAEFLELLRGNASDVQRLESMLDTEAPDAASLSAQFDLVEASCKNCHVSFRD